MSELRRDELSGRWVIIAPGRASRPDAFFVSTPSARPAPAECPFCPGHETDTPPEVTRTGAGPPDGPGWRVRVVPNLYPVVGGSDAGPGITGVHEVVVLSPDHEQSFRSLDDDQAVEVFAVMRDRAHRHLTHGHQHVQPFINQGRTAGASIEHPHAQLVALGLVPPEVEAALARLDDAGADLVAREAADAGAARTVLDGPAPAWCPAASSAPYEVRVAHRSTRARFDEATDAEIAVVARSARGVLARLAAVIGDVPYNLVVHTAPSGRAGFFHWYVEIRPRVTMVAGFEQGTGIFINVVPPERAAAQLQEAVP